MNVRNNESGNIALIAVAVVAGLVIGFAGGSVKNNDKKVDSKNSSTVSANTSTKAAELRAGLIGLGLEHMNLTNIAVDAALHGSPTAEASGAALYGNGTEIGGAVGSVYGPEAEETFNSVWKLHLDQFVNYAVAGSKADEAGKKAALDAIATGYTQPLSAYLAKANPNLSADTLATLLGDHVSMTAAMIDDHIAGSYKEEYVELKHANKHIETIFGALADAIVKQYPEKFKD
jgi:hypothetical protein